MKKLMHLIKIKPLTLTVMLGVLFFFGNALSQTPGIIKAPSGVTYPFQDQTLNDTSNNACDVYMKDFSNKLMVDYLKFIDANFQNKSSTASLLQGGIAKYRELRTSLFIAYGKYYPNVGSAQIMAGVQPGSCRAVIEQTLNDAKIILKQHAVTTSGVKKSTALLQKYQQINAELANLYQQFVYMKAYLDSFASKLSCYPKTGCIKG